MNTTGLVMTVTDELLAELDRSVRAVWHDKGSPVVSVDALTAEIRRLRAENAGLAKDAGRYRWITAQGFATIRPGDDKITLFTIASQHVDADTLDTAIDTAMATQ